MTNFPIFDSLSHPTITGAFPGSKVDTSFAAVSQALRDNGYIGGCAVGMHGVGGYTHAGYFEACGAHDNLFPVAGFDPCTRDPRGEVGRIAELGFRALKVHPRNAGVVLSGQQLGDILQAAGAEGLAVLLCTYYHCALPKYPLADPLFTLVDALQRAPDTRVVLLHGGDVRLLQYAQLVRDNSNLLLDLSFTALKYRGSSIDLDVSYLCAHFDRRICIGVDHPDFDHASLRTRFTELFEGLDEDKAHGAGHRNITEFLGIHPTP